MIVIGLKVCLKLELCVSVQDIEERRLKIAKLTEKHKDILAEHATKTAAQQAKAKSPSLGAKSPVEAQSSAQNSARVGSAGSDGMPGLESGFGEIPSRPTSPSDESRKLIAHDELTADQEKSQSVPDIPLEDLTGNATDMVSQWNLRFQQLVVGIIC